jgi:hypothetical protein
VIDYEELFEDLIAPYAVGVPETLPLHSRLRLEAPLWSTTHVAVVLAKCDRGCLRKAPPRLREALRLARRAFFGTDRSDRDPIGKAINKFREEFPRWLVPQHLRRSLFGEGQQHDYAWFQQQSQAYRQARKGEKDGIRKELERAAVELSQHLRLLPEVTKGRPPKLLTEDEVREMYGQGLYLFSQLLGPSLAMVEAAVSEIIGPETDGETLRIWESHFRLPMLAHQELTAGLKSSQPVKDLVVEAIALRTRLDIKTIENYVRSAVKTQK